MAKNPEKRAIDLHSKIVDDIKRKLTTIAVANTTGNISIVGSSGKYMRTEVLDSLEENEIIATAHYENHAEEDIILEADLQNLKITEIGASRPVCSDCEDLIKLKNIVTRTPFSGKKSRKRKNRKI